MKAKLRIVKEGSEFIYQRRRWLLYRRDEHNAVVSLCLRNDESPFLARFSYSFIVTVKKSNVNEHLSKN